MSKIIFVNPPITIKERYGVKYQSGGETPPLGLAWLAAVCRKNGHQTKIIDTPTILLSQDEIINDILRESPDYIGITAVSISIFSAFEFSQKIKNELPKAKIIIGGPQLTSIPRETMQMFPTFDVGVIGEGEVTIIELLNALDNGQKLNDVQGLVFRQNDNIILTEKRPFIKNLDILPFPAWDLLPDLGKAYCPPVHTVKKLPAALLVPTRGCPGRCTFCDRSVFGRVCRTFSSDYVIKMIEYLYVNYGIREIQFRDDNLVAYPKLLRELCEKLINIKLNIAWSCVGRVDMVCQDDLNLMKRAGCWSISYGIESGNQKILNEIMKGITKEKILNALMWTREAGIESVGFFMAGLPLENEETMRETLAFIKKLPLNSFHMTFFTPLPGTDIYNNTNKYGVFEDDWSKMSTWSPVFIPYGLTKEKLVRYWKTTIRSFYLRPRIIWQYLYKIRSPKHLLIYFNGLLAFVEALLKKRE